MARYIRPPQPPGTEWQECYVCRGRGVVDEHLVLGGCTTYRCPRCKGDRGKWVTAKNVPSGAFTPTNEGCLQALVDGLVAGALKLLAVLAVVLLIVLILGAIVLWGVIQSNT